jgi:excisionase family DNA binding protein
LFVDPTASFAIFIPNMLEDAKMRESDNGLQREALSIAQACAVAGIGRTKIYQAITEGSLKARKCGKRTLILRDELHHFLASLPSAT